MLKYFSNASSKRKLIGSLLADLGSLLADLGSLLADLGSLLLVRLGSVELELLD